MEAALVAFLRSVSAMCPAVTQAELDFLRSGLTLTECKAKHFYILANVIQREIGFVHKGLLRSFYVDHQGNEITVNFITENKYATHYTAFITQTPAKYYFQCMEPTMLVNLPYDHIQQGYKTFPAIERYGRLIAEAVLQFQQKRIESFLFETAEKRYLGGKCLTCDHKISLKLLAYERFIFFYCSGYVNLRIALRIHHINCVPLF